MMKTKYPRLFTALLSIMAVASLLWISACSDDEPKVEPDVTAPTVNITSPTAGAIGVADAILSISSTITDNEELASVEVSIGNGTADVFNETISTFSNPMSYTYNKNITLPDDVPLGEHTLTIIATDKDGNEKTSSVDIVALPAFEDGKTTVRITSVPAITGNDAFYAVGQFQGWNPGIMDNPVTKYTDSEGVVSYYILMPSNAGADQGFKFVRGNDWPFGEKDADGKELDNRKFEEGADFVEMQIAGWRDHNPELVNNSGGSIIAIGGVPTSSTTQIKGFVKKSITGQNAVGTASYTIEKKNGDAFVAVAGQSNVALTLGAENANGESNFSVDVDITGAGFGLGEYRIVVKTTDAAGFKAREDKTLLIVEFPCNGSSLPAVASDKTRFIINVPAPPTDVIYITGSFTEPTGAAIWGTIDPAYQLTKLSTGCYYIDIAVASADKTVQFFREPADWPAGDWWKGQATNTEGSDASAGYTTTTVSNGNTVQLYYKYWRTPLP